MLLKKHLLQKFLAAHRGLAILTILATVAAGAATVALPLVAGRFAGLIMGWQSQRSTLLNPLLGQQSVNGLLAIFTGLVLAKTALSFLDKYLTAAMGERFVFDIRNRLFEHQLRLPLSAYEEKGSGRFLLRFSGDLKSIQSFLTEGLLRFSGYPSLLLLALGVLYALDFTLGLFFLLALLLPVGFTMLVNRRLSHLSVKVRNRKSALLAFASSRLHAVDTIRLFNREIPEQATFYRHSDRVLKAGIRYRRFTSLIQASIPGLLYLSLAALFGFIHFRQETALPVHGGDIVAFVLLLLTIQPILRRLLRVNIVWKMGNISFGKLLQVLNMAESDPGVLSLKVTEGKITVEDLSFGFEPKRRLFRNLNLVFEGRSLTFVTGGAGAGKTTLIKLLTGLYAPRSGRISIDGRNINKINGKELRRRIAVVSTDFPLLGDTVFEAVSYSRKASRRLMAGQLLEQLQGVGDGQSLLQLDDPIGAFGARLSKSQVQLLAFIRAVLTGKPILLLDEPFIHLDPKQVPFWAEQLRLLASERTVVIFSGVSPEPQLRPDRIITLDEITDLSREERSA